MQILTHQHGVVTGVVETGRQRVQIEILVVKETKAAAGLCWKPGHPLGVCQDFGSMRILPTLDRGSARAAKRRRNKGVSKPDRVGVNGLESRKITDQGFAEQIHVGIVKHDDDHIPLILDRLFDLLRSGPEFLAVSGATTFVRGINPGRRAEGKSNAQ